MNKKITVLGLSLLLMVGSVFAQDTKKMQERLNSSYPNLGVMEVEYLKDIKLYEMKMKDNATPGYTNEGIDFFLISGEIVDPKNKVNYSKERAFIKVSKFFNSLPIDKAITVKYGKGTRKMAIFTDPDCPFCKQLDNELHSKITKEDVTIYYFMNPLNIQGHEQAPLKAAKIWCSKDKGKAWVDWMTKGVLPNNDGGCKNPVAETKQFSTDLGFNSTPRIFLDNGYTADQVITAEQLMSAFKIRKP
jgi:thiol:disulfide interchange protein DsbC